MYHNDVRITKILTSYQEKETQFQSFKQVKEVACSKNMNLQTSPEGKVHIFGKKITTCLANLLALKCSSKWVLQKAFSFESSL